MNTDAEHGMSFEEQFAAFSGQTSPRLEEAVPAPLAPQFPTAEHPVPAAEPVAPVQHAPEPPVALTAVPQPVAAPVVAVAPAPTDGGDGGTDSLLADLDRATASLAA